MTDQQFAAIMARLGRIEYKLGLTINGEIATMSALEDLKAEVAATETVEASAIKLIDGLAAQLTDVQAKLAAAGADTTALAAITSQLTADRQGLATAITANTTPPAQVTNATPPPASSPPSTPSST